MNNKDFLHRLKKLISSMPTEARDEILDGINNQIEDANGSNESLIEKFGTPESLAEKYLEDETSVPSLAQKTGSIGKRLLLTVGTITIIIAVAIGTFSYFYSTDEFNYANENAPQLIEGRDQWSSIEWLDPITIHVDQAQAVFYWQAESEFSWKCKNREGIDQGPTGEMIVRHNSCLFYLPLQPTTININQSSVVMVRPQSSTQVDITQSQLRIAENDQQYRYDLVGKRSNIESFKSHDDAEVQISVAAIESTVSTY